MTSTTAAGELDRSARREPPWWVRDGVLAFVVGALLVGSQWIIDDRRSEREVQISLKQSEQAERRENARFVRDRSADVVTPRPFAGMDLGDQSLAGLQMSGANLRGAYLVETRFDGAVMTNADLTNAGLSGTGFHRSKYAQR